MRQSNLVLVGSFLSTASAFPQGILDLPAALLNDLKDLGDNALSSLLNPDDATITTFDGQDQLIDVTGIHEWRAPGPSDARGPCPGLNALANHGYLPRNGYPNIVQFTEATSSVFGMGLDLSTILAAYGAALDGALVSWSIGGKEHTGIGGSHGNYESDSSPMRADLNQYGSNTDLVVSQFQTLFDMQPDAATANYDIDVLSQFRAHRFNESVSKNPYFYYAPFSGAVVTQAAFFFIYRFMANHTEANPDGILDQDTLKSFFAITGESSNFTWNKGYERIPDNWYRRPQSNAYGLNGLSADINTLEQKYPYIAKPGCNTGKVNTFTPIKQTNTNTTAYDFSKPNDDVCYGLAVAITAGNLVPVVSDVIDELLLPLQNALLCPTVPGTNLTVGQECPGYSLYGGPTGPVASGAVQN